MKYEWILTHIQTNTDANMMASTFENHPIKFGAFDTETTGLHIINDNPFVFVFGWIDDYGRAYAVDIERQPELSNQVITWWFNHAAPTLEKLIGHNITFDLHMMANYGVTYTVENMTDTMFYIRWGSDNIPQRSGGPPLGLKEYASQYIDRSAKSYEKVLKHNQQTLSKIYNKKLKEITGMPLKDIDAFFNDKVNEPEDLPEELFTKYNQWLEEIPKAIADRISGKVNSADIPYNILDRESLIKYAMYDIVYTLEIFTLLKPIVEHRANTYAVELEDSLILPLFEMERIGFDVDYDYLLQSKRRLKEYIKIRRNNLIELTGRHFKTGQHKVIKEILNEKYNLPVTTTNNDELSRKYEQLKATEPNSDLTKFIGIIQELRTLEKWYVVYLKRFLKDSAHDGRLYTTINSVGAASGRVTSDFQQFPKKGIKTMEGIELFQPRKMITAPKGEYNHIVYLDYSQIELRVQALYTILVGTPDLNLCRAYMPYKCYHNTLGTFDYSNKIHVSAWKEQWFNIENGEPWVPTDIHGATTCNAFDITPEHPDYKDLRSLGKRLNFAKNYGASINRVRQMFPQFDEQRIVKIDAAYYKTFPGVRDYHTYCYSIANYEPCVSNLFGVKYYGVSGHNLINMLIQGSAATLLKIKIREIYDYCKNNNIKSKWQMQIHDELSWIAHNSEAHIFVEFKRIMEQWEESYVPIVADMELTKTTWAEKEEVEDVSNLRFSN